MRKVLQVYGNFISKFPELKKQVAMVLVGDIETALQGYMQAKEIVKSWQSSSRRYDALRYLRRIFKSRFGKSITEVIVDD